MPARFHEPSLPVPAAGWWIRRVEGRRVCKEYICCPAKFIR